MSGRTRPSPSARQLLGLHARECLESPREPRMTFLSSRSRERSPFAGASHVLRATPKTVHWGYFDASLAPVLRVKSGDIIQAEAITHHAGDAPELMMDEAVTALFKGVPENDRT